MATVEHSANASRASLFGLLWQLWRKKRKRNRIRSLSQVRFRLTREGVHYIGILLFIFISAVLRDINLLVLLAGAMIGLLLLQWRFTTRSLLSLDARRYLPRSTNVGTETEIEIQLANPKKWLGSWLVLVEEPLSKILPTPQKLTEKGLAVVDEIRPKATNSAHYSLNFQQRGRFQVGPSTISTRFPLGLGRGSRTLDNAGAIIVLPRLGKLTARAQSLYQQEMQGSAKSSPKAGLHEADFYGLRPWATGDSRRWIHWRTTARLGQLSVRQFERQQRRQICVLLDLYRPRARAARQAVDENCEKAISFVATLAAATCLRGGDHLAVAVAADEHFAAPNVQSAVLVDSLLERLSVISASDDPKLAQALQGITLPLLNNSNLLVVSTRSDQTQLSGRQFLGLGSNLFSRINITWLDVSHAGLEPYFSWT